jgi:hypothetical protein
MKKILYTVLGIVVAFVAFSLYSDRPTSMTADEIQQMKQAIMDNDSKAKKVDFDERLRHLTIVRDIEPKFWENQDMQAESWCTSFPDVSIIMIKHTSGRRVGYTRC